LRNSRKVQPHQGPWHRHPADGILAAAFAKATAAMGSQCHIAIERRLNAVLQLRFAGRTRAMNAAEDLSVGLNAVPDNPAIAMRANRRQRVDSALKAVEGVMFSINHNFKRLVIFVFANFACTHT
jgi:hypothetical protein